MPVLVVGNSHASTLSLAYDAQKDDGILVLRCSTYPKQPFPALSAPLFARYKPQVAVSLIGGNHHNVLGLLEAPEPFDFMLPQWPQTLPGRRVVPIAQVRAALLRDISPSLTRINRMRAAFDVPMAHVASPPPVGDENHLKAYPGGFAANAGPNIKITPKSVRLKLYLLQNEIIKAHCEERNITFIPAPAAALDEDGFLSERCRRNDPTHGNARFARLVLETIKAFAAPHLSAAQFEVPEADTKANTA